VKAPSKWARCRPKAPFTYTSAFEAVLCTLVAFLLPESDIFPATAFDPILHRWPLYRDFTDAVIIALDYLLTKQLERRFITGEAQFVIHNFGTP